MAETLIEIPARRGKAALVAVGRNRQLLLFLLLSI